MKRRDQLATAERVRRARIEGAFMNPRQRTAFEVYYSLGPNRTLERVIEVCQAQGLDYSIWMVRRWCAQFKWADLVLQTDVQVSTEIAERCLPNHIERAEKALKYLAALEDKFYEKVDKGEVDVSLMDFVTLLKTGSMLRGLPTEASETIHAHRFEIDLGDDELRAALRLDVLKKRGLPLPRSVNTIEPNVGEGQK